MDYPSSQKPEEANLAYLRAETCFPTGIHSVLVNGQVAMMGPNTRGLAPARCCAKHEG